MAAYVLVPGAWLGGWVWQRVAREVRAGGHDVYPATLTGLGDRVHLARPDTDLETHITDVVNLIAYEDLADVVLVGHSYAGAVITGVADRVPDRIGRLVYVDTGPLADGETVLGFSSPEEQEQARRHVEEQGEGWRLPPIPFAHLPMNPLLEGLSDADRALLQARAVPHPFQTYLQPLRLAGAGAPSAGRCVIACSGVRMLEATGLPQFQLFAAPGWRRVDLATGHWPMLSQPNELAAALRRLAGEPGPA